MNYLDEELKYRIFKSANNINTMHTILYRIIKISENLDKLEQWAVINTMNLTWNIYKVLDFGRNMKGMDINCEILYLLAIHAKRSWCLTGIKAKHKPTGYCNFEKGKCKCIVLSSRKSIVLTTSRLVIDDTLKNLQRLGRRDAICEALLKLLDKPVLHLKKRSL